MYHDEHSYDNVWRWPIIVLMAVAHASDHKLQAMYLVCLLISPWSSIHCSWTSSCVPRVSGWCNAMTVSRATSICCPVPTGRPACSNVWKIASRWTDWAHCFASTNWGSQRRCNHMSRYVDLEAMMGLPPMHPWWCRCDSKCWWRLLLMWCHERVAVRIGLIRLDRCWLAMVEILLVDNSVWWWHEIHAWWPLVQLYLEGKICNTISE